MCVASNPGSGIKMATKRRRLRPQLSGVSIDGDEPADPLPQGPSTVSELAQYYDRIIAACATTYPEIARRFAYNSRAGVLASTDYSGIDVIADAVSHLAVAHSKACSYTRTFLVFRMPSNDHALR